MLECAGDGTVLTTRPVEPMSAVLAIVDYLFVVVNWFVMY